MTDALTEETDGQRFNPTYQRAVAAAAIPVLLAELDELTAKVATLHATLTLIAARLHLADQLDAATAPQADTTT